ncbi:MAG: hypothetical protein ACE5GU_14665 [Candidatus Scalinduaceae bacterium]
MVKKTLSIWKEKNIGLVDSQLIAMSTLGDAKCIYSSVLIIEDNNKTDNVKKLIILHF